MGGRALLLPVCPNGRYLVSRLRSGCVKVWHQEVAQAGRTTATRCPFGAVIVRPGVVSPRGRVTLATVSNID